MNLKYSNFDLKFVLCLRYCVVLCYNFFMFSIEIVIINKIYFLLYCRFGICSYIEIFIKFFLELSLYILGISREIFF